MSVFVCMAYRDALRPANAVALAFATIAATFACSGAVWGSYLGEETSQRSDAFGSTVALIGLLGALLVAVPLILVTLAIPDLQATLGSPSPLATFVAVRGGAELARLLSVVVVVAIFANLLAMTIALSRFIFAIGRGGTLPAKLGDALSRVDRCGVPIVATIILVAAALPLLLLPEQTLLILLSAELISPLLVALAVLIGRRRVRDRRYRVAAYPLLPLIGMVLACMFLLLEWNEPETGRRGLIVLAMVIAVVTIARSVRRED